MLPESPSTSSRRDFLAAGAAFAGAIALGVRPTRGDLLRAGDYGPFKMGLQSYSLRHYKTAEALAKTKDLGVHFWESYSAHTNPDPAKAAEYKSLAAASGVEVIGYGVSSFTKDHEKNRKFFEFGKAMGVGYLSADPTTDAFESLDKLTEEYGIPIGIHPHGPGSRWEKIDQIAAAIKPHSDKIGICLDTGHLLRSKEDPVRAVDVFGKRIYGVHLKDVKGSNTFTILGEGDLALATLLQKLAQLNYSYCVALEYEENEKDPIADIQKCLDATKAAIAKIKA
jgi:sugar phosphate isomerase/epimerase